MIMSWTPLFLILSNPHLPHPHIQCPLVLPVSSPELLFSGPATLPHLGFCTCLLPNWSLWLHLWPLEPILHKPVIFVKQLWSHHHLPGIPSLQSISPLLFFSPCSIYDCFLLYQADHSWVLVYDILFLTSLRFFPCACRKDSHPWSIPSIQDHFSYHLTPTPLGFWNIQFVSIGALSYIAS